MTKRVLSVFAVLLILFILPAAVSLSSGAISTEEQQPVSEVLGIRQARFENMLNHNYLYGSDFLSDRTVIENAILALLDYSENDEIDQNLVLQFIMNMYGRQVDPNAAVYDFLPASEGRFAILARGYSKVSHKVAFVEEVDGGWKVFSNMTVEPHDGEGYTVLVETLFVPNAGSSFGYNIVRSDLVSEAANAAL